MDMMHAGDMTHKRTWSKYDILWCQNCCYWSLCSPLCVRFQQNVNFTDIMTLGKTLDVRTTGRTFWSLWRWPWSFSRTAAKLHCWIFRRTLLRYVGPSVCRNTANDMSRPVYQSPTHDLGGLLDIVVTRNDLPSPAVVIDDVGLSDHRLLRWVVPLHGLPAFHRFWNLRRRHHRSNFTASHFTAC